MIPTKLDAIHSLLDGTPYLLNTDEDGDIALWDSTGTQPTTSEIDDEVVRLTAIYNGLAYSRERRAKYNLLNQDEMRFDDLVNSTTTWVDAINAIKAAHPKP
jgi:hypothetical protein